MKVAIVGSGIAGNVAAYHLSRDHDVVVYEANAHAGGHTHTHQVEQAGREYAVDTGFIVYNDWTYPNFIALLDELGVASQPSAMSFSVRDERANLEYNGTSLNGLFAQRSNLLRPSFWRMLQDILRFNRESLALLADEGVETSLGDYLEANRYSQAFVERYIVPMGAAIWSTDPRSMRAFPARFFVRFLRNHGMLSVNDRPQWRVIQGGSARYVEKLTATYRDRIRLNEPVRSIRRIKNGALVKAAHGDWERFDAVFLACHSDQALRLLEDPSPTEREVLGAIPYQPNEAVLHTDTRLLPKRRLAWAAWNYHIPREEPESGIRSEAGPAKQGVALTYNMNILQSLDSPQPFLVTLNRSDAIDPKKVLKRIRYEHPLFTPASVAAQARQEEINGPLSTYFCGAWWRNGFHEDGVVSALDALRHFHNRCAVSTAFSNSAGSPDRPIALAPDRLHDRRESLAHA